MNRWNDIQTKLTYSLKQTDTTSLSKKLMESEKTIKADIYSGGLLRLHFLDKYAIIL